MLVLKISTSHFKKHSILFEGIEQVRSSHILTVPDTIKIMAPSYSHAETSKYFLIWFLAI